MPGQALRPAGGFRLREVQDNWHTKVKRSALRTGCLYLPGNGIRVIVKIIYILYILYIAPIPYIFENYIFLVLLLIIFNISLPRAL
jgi:hypothetical protein